MTNFKPAETIPSSAFWLGLAGLIPFAGAAVSVWLPDYRALAFTAGIAYGAVILSFLGGIRWGTAIGPYSSLRSAREFALSVLPSLAGWAALLVPQFPALCVMVAGFLLQALWDVTSTDQGRLPGWFGRLRMILTTGAVISLLSMMARRLI